MYDFVICLQRFQVYLKKRWKLHSYNSYIIIVEYSYTTTLEIQTKIKILNKINVWAAVNFFQCLLNLKLEYVFSFVRFVYSLITKRWKYNTGNCSFHIQGISRSSTAWFHLHPGNTQFWIVFDRQGAQLAQEIYFKPRQRRVDPAGFRH